MPGQAKSVGTSKRTTSPAPLKLLPARDLLERVQQLHDLIERRAFEIFDGNGRTFGHELEDWFNAESELLHPVHIEVAEADGNLTVRAEVPGFTAKELEVSVEPLRITISGKRDTKKGRKDERTAYTERCSNQVLRVIDLPEAVNSDKPSASLRDGVLELTMPKAAPAKKIQIESKTS
jgi:HSP20 family protein